MEKKDGKTIYNADVWGDLIYLTKRFKKVNITHVSAHLGYKFNERCDKLVQETIRKEERRVRQEKLIEKLKSEGIDLYVNEDSLPNNLKTKGMMRREGLVPLSCPVGKFFNGSSIVSLYDINLEIASLDDISVKCRARNYFEIYYEHRFICGELNAKEEAWDWLVNKYDVKKYEDFLNIEDNICESIINDIIPYLKKHNLKSDDIRIP